MASASGDTSSRRTGLRAGFRVQLRVVGALMMRELHTRYGRENIGYLWLFLEPMLLATMISIIHIRSEAHFGGDMKPIPMALVGYCNFMTFRSIFSRAEGALESNLPLMYHRTVSVFDILLSRALLEAAGSWIAFVVLIGLAIAVGIADLPQRPLILLGGMILMFLLSFGLSMVVCGVTHDNRSIGRLIHPMTYVMMPLSGAFFTMEYLPTPIRDVFLTIPLAHVFEIIRFGWFRSASPEYFDLMYLGWWILISNLIGLLLISVVRKRIHIG